MFQRSCHSGRRIEVGGSAHRSVNGSTLAPRDCRDFFRAMLSFALLNRRSYFQIVVPMNLWRVHFEPAFV
jgi:hypothetical protein